MVVGMCKVTVWGTHVHSHTHTRAYRPVQQREWRGRVRERGWGSRLFHNLCVCVCVCVCVRVFLSLSLSHTHSRTHTHTHTHTHMH